MEFFTSKERFKRFKRSKKKRIKQKTNPKASKMKLFMILVDALFGKQLNKTKNPISDAAGALDLPLHYYYFKETCVIFSSFQNMLFTCLRQAVSA